MATEPAAQWAEPSTRISMARIVEHAQRATAYALHGARLSALHGVRLGRAAARNTTFARAWTIHAARTAAAGAAFQGRAWAARLARHKPAPDSQLALAALWTAGLGTAWLVYAWTGSWPQAAVAATCLVALSTLQAMHRAQRREALAIHQQLGELRQALRVTQALLDVDVLLDDAEHIDEDSDALEASTRRYPQRVSHPQAG